MGVRLSVLLLASLPVVAQTQTSLPPDIHPVTLSRLPPVTPEDLDEEGRRLLEKAEKSCLVTNSLKVEPALAAEVVTASPPET